MIDTGEESKRHGLIYWMKKYILHTLRVCKNSYFLVLQQQYLINDISTIF